MRPSALAWIIGASWLAACGGETPGGSDGDAAAEAETGADDGAGEDAPGPEDGGDATVEDDASVASFDLPETMACGTTFSASVVMTNRGTATWTRAAGYKLGAVDDSDPFYSPDPRVWLPEGASVPPGGSYSFDFTLTAPATPGTYVTDWRMVREGAGWFGATASRSVEVACEAPPRRTGPVRLSGNSLADDGGEFNALGTTMMWAAWAYKFDRPKLERNLDAIARAGFDYVRALGVVGWPDNEDYWDGREIDWHWPDHDAVIAGLTDLAYDGYGLRVEWTLIGDGQLNIPEEADRYALVDRFLAMSVGREQKIILFEIANEAWQNGFDGDAGNAQLRALTSHMRDRTAILVAASAPPGNECSDYQRVYGGDVADVATIHFDRNVGTVEDGWRPVRQPWELEFCDDVPVGSNNEPIGPGSSVASETDPVRLVAAAINTFVSNVPMYVYHTRAGVRGDFEIYDMEGFGSFTHVRNLVPGSLASWTRKNAHWGDSPFVVYAGDAGGLHADQMWVDLADPTSGCVRAYGDVGGEEFLVFPIGILGSVTMAPRRDAAFEVFDPMTGERVGEYVLGAGEQFTLGGHEALVIRGRYR